MEARAVAASFLISALESKSSTILISSGTISIVFKLPSALIELLNISPDSDLKTLIIRGSALLSPIDASALIQALRTNKSVDKSSSKVWIKGTAFAAFIAPKALTACNWISVMSISRILIRCSIDLSSRNFPKETAAWARIDFDSEESFNISINGSTVERLL